MCAVAYLHILIWHQKLTIIHYWERAYQVRRLRPQAVTQGYRRLSLGNRPADYIHQEYVDGRPAW